MLRNAFSVYEPSLLPENIIWRTKEAFSDGVSKQSRSWHTIIKEYCSKLFHIPDGISEKTFVDKHAKLLKLDTHNRPTTLEQLHYRMIFNKYYNGHSNVIPYFWMPNFVDATDASARTLDIYKKKKEKNDTQELLY